MKHELSRRRFMQLSAGIAGATALAACAAPTAPAPAGGGESPKAEAVTITFLALHEGWANIWESFNEVHPDVTVEADFLPWDAFFEQIQVRLASGSGDPDVLEVDVPLTASYGFREWLIPLDDLFTQDEVDDWVSAAYTAGKYEGDLISAPMRTSTQLLYYNKTLLDATGVTPPGEDERWTWEQLAEAAKQATVDANDDGVPEIWGYMWEQFIRIYQLQPMPLSLGGTAIGDDGLTVRGIIDSPEWIDAFTYYSKAFNEWKIAPQGEIGTPSDMFRNGTLAFELAGNWNIPPNYEVEFEWGVSRHPYFEGGEVVTPTGSWHIGINSASSKPEAGSKLVHWAATMPGAETLWREAFQDMPAQKSMLEKWMTDPEFDERPQYFNRIAADEATQNPQPRPVTPGYLEYEEILGDTFEDIRNGSDVATSLGTAVDRIEAEMVKYA